MAWKDCFGTSSEIREHVKYYNTHYQFFPTPLHPSPSHCPLVTAISALPGDEHAELYVRELRYVPGPIPYCDNVFLNFCHGHFCSYKYGLRGNLNSAFSLKYTSNLATYEEGVKFSLHVLPSEILDKIEKGQRLSWLQQLRATALKEMKEHFGKSSEERLQDVQRIADFTK